eukprot:6213977-Pleurochrysis_carterae.AAC.1
MSREKHNCGASRRDTVAGLASSPLSLHGPPARAVEDFWSCATMTIATTHTLHKTQDLRSCRIEQWRRLYLGGALHLASAPARRGMAEAERQQEPPEAGIAVPRYNEVGRLLTPDLGSILPTEWIGDARTVDGEHHYDAVLIGWEGSAQFKVAIGDCVYLSPDSNAKGWCEVGQVKDLYLAVDGDFIGEKVCVVRWLYRKSGVKGVSARSVHQRELLISPVAEDVNLVESIEGLVKVLFYTNREEASTRIQEPNTFFCCRTYDADEQAIDDLQLPPSPPPPPPPPPPEPQPHTPPPVQPHTTAVPMDAEPSIPEPGVTDSAAPVAAENPTAAAGGEKRTRKSSSSRTALNVLDGKLQHALDEIAILKQQMMELQARVVCIQSSSGFSAVGTTVVCQIYKCMNYRDDDRRIITGCNHNILLSDIIG